MPALPKSLILEREQKVLVEQHIGALEAALAMTPLDHIGHAELTMTTVTKMTLVLPSRETGDLAGEARGEAFMAALDDIPSWAVQEAMRKWHRGEHGPKYDYKWQPVPSTLRELALNEVWRVRGAVRKMNELLMAEALVEISPEQEEAMKARVRTLLSMKTA